MITVEELIKNSLQELQKISWENEILDKKQETKLIFPKYCIGNHAETKRRSEQEARVLFIRELEKNKEHNFYYSIETPTKKPYKDFDTEPDFGEIGENEKVEKGGSASVDVTLYEKGDKNFCRKHLIEFKFGNVKTCQKDFLKLLCDDNELETNYYVNIIKYGQRINNTINNLIKEKYRKSIDCIKEKHTTCSGLTILVFVYRENETDDKTINKDEILKFNCDYSDLNIEIKII